MKFSPLKGENRMKLCLTEQSRMETRRRDRLSPPYALTGSEERVKTVEPKPRLGYRDTTSANRSRHKHEERATSGASDLINMSAHREPLPGRVGHYPDEEPPW